MRPQTQFVSLFCFHFLLVSYLASAKNTSHSEEVSDFHVGVVLDFNSTIGKVGWNCIQFSLADFYATHTDYRTRLFLHQRDSQGDNVKASLAVLDLLQNVEVEAIIGPQTSAQAGFALDFGDKAQVPIMSFSATSPSSFPTPYFVQATRNDSSQVKAITAIVQAFKWREVAALYEDSNYGNGMISYIIDDLQEEQIKVPYRNGISLLDTDDQIRVELYKMMNLHYRVFIVHMSFTLGARFFLLAKEVGMMSEGYVWITTDGLMNFLGSLDSTSLASMEGVLGVKPYVRKSSKLDNFTDRWRSQYRQDLNVYGLWAYDMVWNLAMAAEVVGETTSLPKVMTTNSNLTDITTIRTSKVGPKLLEVISRTRFEGLSGDFYFVNGQLKSDIVQILNVNGKNGREIGFWTSEHGISKELQSRKDETNTISESNLHTIIWPGDSVNVPKGWTIPAGGMKLKIGVPVKAGFNEFARVDRDNSTNKTTISGYSIDVFNMVMKALPYPVAYEFEPFMNADGSSAGSNDECIHQVFVERYDAVVGDFTITSSRSFYVDFTLSYTEGGVSMMVPIIENSKERAWFFWKPLSLNLWLTIGAFFILTGFVIWVLEHRSNEDFRGGSLSNNLGIICCFPLSTSVFAQREKIVNNLTRFVVVVWVFVILILNSSYTASLSSILTVEKLQPSITSVDELIRNGDCVGYQKGSFVVDLLKALHFEESKLKPFISQQEMVKALLKGSQNGGISAFFSRVPYIKLYIAKYGNRYTMVGPTSKTEGFGFAFPKGSPLVADVSRAILLVSNSSEMIDLDRKFYATQANSTEPEASSNGISFESFHVLFIITGTVSGFALLVYFAGFLYKNKQVLTRSGSNNTVWTRTKAALKRFDEKDLTCRTFKENPISYTASHYTEGNMSPPLQLQIITIHGNDVNLEEMEDVRLED